MPGPCDIARRTVRGVLGALLVAGAAGALIPPPPARAHAVLVKSAPASRAALSYPPDRADLWFSERLEPAFSTLSVWSSAGARVDRQDTAVGSDDARRLSVSLGRLAPGTYIVRFRVLSVDGHVVEGSFPFTVRPTP